MEKMISKMDVIRVKLSSGKTSYLLSDSSDTREVQEEIEKKDWLTKLASPASEDYDFVKDGKIRTSEIIFFSCEGEHPVRMV